VFLAGEAMGSYKSMSGEEVKVSLSAHNVMAGPRLVWRMSRVEPHVQMLFGVARFASAFELPAETLSDAQHYFAMAPSACIDIPFSARSAFRAGMGVRLVRAERLTPGSAGAFTFHELQFLAGIVFR
jgi:hypothetical protein